MAIPTINGQWWLQREGKQRLETMVNVRRGKRTLQVLKYMNTDYRVYQNNTDANDSDARDPDVGELWWDPMEGQPTAVTDWMVGKAEVVFDVNSGKATMKVAAAKLPEDWDGVEVVGDAS